MMVCSRRHARARVISVEYLQRLMISHQKCIIPDRGLYFYTSGSDLEAVPDCMATTRWLTQVQRV